MLVSIEGVLVPEVDHLIIGIVMEIARTFSWCTISLLLLSQLLAPGSVSPFAAGDETRECGPMTGAECDLFHAINRARRRERLAPLVADPDAVRMAREQARDMGIHGYFSHDRPPVGGRGGESFKERVRRFRLTGSAAENLSNSTGYEIDESLEKAVDGWLKSQGHRKNILNAGFRLAGVGHYRWAEKVRTRQGPRNRWHDMWVQVFSSGPARKDD